MSSYGVVLILAGCLCALRFRLDLGSKAAFTIVIFPLREHPSNNQASSPAARISTGMRRGEREREREIGGDLT